MTALLVLAGCQTPERRIAEHSSEFAALAPRLQDMIRNGSIQLGFTPQMVYMASGQPTEKVMENGHEVWIYRLQPVLAHNETYVGGYVRRRVFDPVKRTESIVMEPVDEKAFPHSVPRTIRVTFTNGRVSHIDQKRR